MGWQTYIFIFQERLELVVRCKPNSSLDGVSDDYSRAARVEARDSALRIRPFHGGNQAGLLYVSLIQSSLPAFLLLSSLYSKSFAMSKQGLPCHLPTRRIAVAS